MPRAPDTLQHLERGSRFTEPDADDGGGRGAVLDYGAERGVVSWVEGDVSVFIECGGWGCGRRVLMSYDSDPEFGEGNPQFLLFSGMLGASGVAWWLESSRLMGLGIRD